MALGIPTKRIASTEEVRNRKAEQGEEARIREDAQRERAATKPAPENNGDAKLLSGAAQQRLGEIILSRGRTVGGVLAAAQKRGIGSGLLETLTVGQAKQIAEAMKGLPEAAGADAAPEQPEEPTAATEGPAPQDESKEEMPPGMDADEYKAKRDAEALAARPKAKKVGGISDDTLQRICRQTAELEKRGCIEDEWRYVLAESEGVTSRKDLNQAAGQRMIKVYKAWLDDLKSGVRHPGEDPLKQVA